MRSSRKGKTAPEKKRDFKTERLVSQHQRLYQALNLGTRSYDGSAWKWQSADIEIQRHAVRSISLFVDCISRNTSDHPLVKVLDLITGLRRIYSDRVAKLMKVNLVAQTLCSIVDMIGALLWVLKHSSAALQGMTTKTVVNLIRKVPNSLLQPYLLDLVDPSLSMLSSSELDVSVSSATALNFILSNLKAKDEKQVREKLHEKETGSLLINNLCGLSVGQVPSDYFKEMAFLLSTILHRWPSFRYKVWSNTKLMEILGILCRKPDDSLVLAVLKLYSGLALCGKGASKLLENEEVLLPMLILFMGESYPLSIRIEGFRLARCLVTNEQGCLTLMRCCCEPFVQAVMCGLRLSSQSSKVATEEMMLLMEASRLALVLRWEGKHNDYFWKEGIDRELLDLLGCSHDEPAQQALPLEEQISSANEHLQKKNLLTLRPYIWDVLGWLVTNCSQDLNSRINDHLDTLIICACLSFVDSINKGREDLASQFQSEAASRAALMMIHSPCKYIVSKAVSALSEIFKTTGKAYMRRILYKLNAQQFGHDFGISEPMQAGIDLMTLACCSALPQYKGHIVESGGIKTLLNLMRSCMSNNVCLARMNLAPHLRNDFCEKACCLVNEDWEGNDSLLLYILIGLSELLPSLCVSNVADRLHEAGYDRLHFVSTLEDICCGTYSPGLKWYAAHLLCYFGEYGFPSKLGSHVGKFLKNDDYVDLLLVLPEGSSTGAHCVILASRCPALLPCELLPANAKASNSIQRYNVPERYDKSCEHIRLSSQVGSEALTKLLDFIYLGFLHAEEDLVKKLKVLARHCCLQSLLMVLGKRCPKWGIVWPSYDLMDAVGPRGYHFSDIILEAKPIESTWEACSFCSIEVPHVHAHKVVLSSRSDYMRALLQSGMQERCVDAILLERSNDLARNPFHIAEFIYKYLILFYSEFCHSSSIKVPVGWEAVSKLVTWFYTDNLPCPSMGCQWDNMTSGERLFILQPYIELCWLAGFWFLDEIKDTCTKVVLSRLDSSAHLLLEVIKITANFSLWDLAEVAACNLAPAYRQLCWSGVLEGLDEELVEMIRVASVRLSQEEP